MKPNELQEGQEIQAIHGKTRIRFIRDYGIITIWAGTTDDQACEKEIQIAVPDDQVDQFFDAIVLNNQELPGFKLVDPHPAD